MNTRDYSEFNVRFRASISVKAETAKLLSEMALDMGITIDDVLSFLAEDAVIDLKRNYQSLDEVIIPEKCSQSDLLRAMERFIF